jgi:hypothetical protein
MNQEWHEVHISLRQHFHALTAELHAVQDEWRHAVSQGDFTRQSSLMARRFVLLTEILAVVAAHQSMIFRFITEATRFNPGRECGESA